MPTSLSMQFANEDSKSISWTIPYAKVTATPTQIKALMQAVVDNGDIYIDVPETIVKAEFIDRTVTPIALPE